VRRGRRLGWWCASTLSSALFLLVETSILLDRFGRPLALSRRLIQDLMLARARFRALRAACSEWPAKSFFAQKTPPASFVSAEKVRDRPEA